MNKFIENHGLLVIVVIAMFYTFTIGYNHGYLNGLADGNIHSMIIEQAAEIGELKSPNIPPQLPPNIFMPDEEIPPPSNALTPSEEEINKLIDEFIQDMFPGSEKFDNEFVNPDKYHSAKLTDEERCLARNLYFEARDQSIKGQLAVAMVTLNRVESKRYPNSICKVVWQKSKTKSGKWVAQFSWTLDGAPDVPREKDAWEKSKFLAKFVLDKKDVLEEIKPVKGATHYHATYVAPKWSKKLKFVAQIDDHKFYRMTVAKN